MVYRIVPFPMTFSDLQGHAPSTSLLKCVFTGSIARSASRRYLVYSEADFEVFRPAGATRYTDGVKFGMEQGPFSMPNFTPIGATTRV